jgi:hypothetical protein
LVNTGSVGRMNIFWVLKLPATAPILGMNTLRLAARIPAGAAPPDTQPATQPFATRF